MTVIEEIAAERRRQIEREGWSQRHDDHHNVGDLSNAGACYALRAYQLPSDAPPDAWPWGWVSWKPKNPRRDLIRAAALIVAEIERFDRTADGDNDE